MKNKKNGNFAAMLIQFLVGGFCGIFIILSADPEKLFGGTTGDFATRMFFGILLMFAAFLIQTVFHEVGHLVFGLLTGYKFISLRIGIPIHFACSTAVKSTSPIKIPAT